MWVVWLCCIAVFIAALIAAAFIRMPIEFEYMSSAQNNKQVFRVRVCRINLIRDKEKKADDDSGKRRKKKDKGQKKAHKGVKNDKKNEKFGFSQFMERIDRVKRIYRLIEEDIQDVFGYLKSKTMCQNFTVHLDFGFDDAAKTGIAAGVAYGVVYGFASIVYNNITLDKNDMDIAVNPHFDRQCTDLYIKSIFCLSFAHIIKVLAILLKINKKIRKTIKQ